MNRKAALHAAMPWLLAATVTLSACASTRPSPVPETGPRAQANEDSVQQPQPNAIEAEKSQTEIGQGRHEDQERTMPDSPRLLEVTLEPLPESTATVMVDQVANVSLFATWGRSYTKFWTESNSEVLAEGRGLSPVLMSDGSVVYADSEDLSLKRLFTNGEVQELLPSGSVGGALRLSLDRKFLGFAIPIDLPPGSTEVGMYGAGILDLDTGQVVVSRAKDGIFTHPHGWYQNQLLVSEWNSEHARKTMSLHALTSNGDFSEFALDLPLARTAPEVSPDHQWMSYEDRDGNTILVNLDDLSLGTIPDVEAPKWTPEGLTGRVDGSQVMVRFSIGTH